MTEPVRPDNPNQSVVRPDGSGPAEEGDGAGKAPAKASKATSSKKGTGSSDSGDAPEEAS